MSKLVKPISSLRAIPIIRGLYFKQVHSKKPIYSVRVTRDYRALGIRDGDEIVWFWIGSHAEYDRLLSQL